MKTGGGAAGGGSASGSGSGAGEPPLDATLAAIAAGTSCETGTALFELLARRLPESTGVSGAWVTEWIPEARRLRALAFWLDGRLLDSFEYDIRGTPCEAVVEERRLCHVPDRVVELFPGDVSLAEMGAVSYLGMPLEDLDGALLGHLALLDDRPLPRSARLESILRIFAGRAAAELRRLRRDRTIEAQRRKLSRLFDSTLDAILELDDALRVTQMNRAARELFGEALAGSSFREHLTTASAETLSRTAAGLGRGRGPRSAWIEGGLDCVDERRAIFPAEATLSSFVSDGEVFHTLVVRSLRERAQALERIESLTEEAESLREQLARARGHVEIVGSSPAMQRVLFDVGHVAGTEATVLVTGETGTGKELVARAIHALSPRSREPLVKVNCAAIPAGLQESEFFGHERGAFTGATQRRRGRFELADGGTLFLDEVAELPLDLQAKLLRVLQEGEFEPVGASRTVRVDVRVVAATNRELREMIAAGSFREDLYYRLAVFPLELPPLRERGEDVVSIAEALLRSMAERKGYRRARLTPDDCARILSYDWPGNVRELQNVLERALITSSGSGLDLAHLLPERPFGPMARSTPEPRERILTSRELVELERENVRRALESARWKISGPGGAAELLGLNPNTLTSRMKALGLTRPRR